MKPEEKEAIDRANAAKAANTNGATNPNNNGKKTTSTQEVNQEKAVDTKTGAQQIQDRLAAPREAVAKLTESYVLSGIPLGLKRIAEGDFSAEGEQVFDMVDDFASALTGLVEGNTYQLLAAGTAESKKMLSASPDTATAATVVS